MTQFRNFNVLKNTSQSGSHSSEYDNCIMQRNIIQPGKGKAFHNKLWRLRLWTECLASILTLTFGTTGTAEHTVW
jgi:hypothetical protein